nr:unnamed protein product [Spirometra erinaceieuropaei]
MSLHYIEPNSWFAIVPMILNCIGILATIGVIVTLALYSETPIVRATGRELTYLLLSGCLLCYLSSLLLLIEPNPAVCGIQRVGIGLGFAIMYASLLTKTNRLARIFDAAKRTAKRPAFISPRSQLVIAGGLIGLQFALSAIWLGFDPPATRIDPLQSNFLVLRCAIKDSSLMTSLAYIMLLIVVCTIHAVKTRCIPENFNESKFIGFAMYTTCIIWLAFVPIYFATMSNFEIQVSTLSVSVSLSATVTLVCLFAPKLYIIYFQPEKNIRKLTMNSGTSNKNKYAMSKSPPESFARQSSSLGTEYVLTNPMHVSSLQPSVLLTTSDSNQMSSERGKSFSGFQEISSTRPLLNSLSEASPTANVLIPRRDSSDVCSKGYVGTSTVGPSLDGQDSNKPRLNYQAIVSPMPLLLDSVAGSVASVPAYLYEEDAAAESSSTHSSISYSRKPTTSEVSIENPKLDGYSSNEDQFVYNNFGASLITPPQAPNPLSDKDALNPVSGKLAMGNSLVIKAKKDCGLIDVGHVSPFTVTNSTTSDLWEQAPDSLLGPSPPVRWRVLGDSFLIDEEKISSV